MGYVTDELAAEAPHLTRQRGRDYFQRGRVREIAGEEHWVEAIVQGSERYEVELNVIENGVDYSCSCPYYVREFDLCKHIWAAALAAEARGLLSDLKYHKHAAVRRAENGSKESAKQKARESNWKDSLRTVKELLDAGQSESKDAASIEREVFYVIDAERVLASESLIVEVACRERKLDGNWGKIKSLRLYPSEIQGFQEPSDQQIVSILLGAYQDTGYGYSSYHYNSSSQFAVPKALWQVLLPLACATGRCGLRASKQAVPTPLRWDDGVPWELCIEVTLDENADRYVLTGKLRREGAEMRVTAPELLVSGGLVFHQGVVARLEDHGAFAWVPLLRQRLRVEFGKGESEAFLDELLRLPRQPQLVLPDEFKYEIVTQPPQPHLVIKRGEKRPWGEARLIGELSFDYGGELVPAERPGITVYKKDQRQLLTRDLIAETAAKQKLFGAGFRTSYWTKERSDIAPAQLPRVVRLLTAEGWHVEAEGSLYRTANSISMEVSSGVDWFELGGAVQFGEAKVPLPRLLRAIKQGEQTIRLDDGTFGVVPDAWMKKYGLLAGVAGASGDKLRFSRPQAGLLDALLASEPEVHVDAVFERVRRELRDFSGVRDAEPTAEFCGALRSYQRDGLGWLQFLQRFGFGGCLADDMGLGKTVQVLALLEARRELRCAAEDPAPPSLIGGIL